jgi:hypothetical protein
MKFILEQPDVNISKVRVALRDSPRMQRIDNAVTIMQAFSQVSKRCYPPCFRARDCRGKQLEEIDSRIQDRADLFENYVHISLYQTNFLIFNLKSPIPTQRSPSNWNVHRPSSLLGIEFVGVAFQFLCSRTGWYHIEAYALQFYLFDSLLKELAGYLATVTAL